MAKREREPKGGAPALEIDATPHASSATKARLREHYQKNVIPALVKNSNYRNVMAVPRVEKVSINIGMGEATGNQKLIDSAVQELATIDGTAPVVTKAKKSIAAFKLREGMS